MADGNSGGREYLLGRIDGRLDGIEKSSIDALDYAKALSNRLKEQERAIDDKIIKAQEAIEEKLEKGAERMAQIEKRIYIIVVILAVILSALGIGADQLLPMMFPGTPPVP